MITQQRLKEVLGYDPETGVFIWKVSLSFRAKAGKKAGCLRKDGYIVTSIDGIEYLAHRLAWFYVYGSWPCGDTDHINIIRSDNRISNLREATRSENCQNQRKARSDNKTSGLLGVCYDKKRKKWRATIKIDGKQQFLGRHTTVEDAQAAYLDAKRKIHPFCTT